MNDFERRIITEAVEKTINERRIITETINETIDKTIKEDEEEKTIKIFKYNLCKIQNNNIYLRDKLHEQEVEVAQLNNNLINYCNTSINGHDFIIEIESGHYGDTYTICKKCGYEK